MNVRDCFFCGKFLAEEVMVGINMGEDEDYVCKECEGKLRNDGILMEDTNTILDDYVTRCATTSTNDCSWMVRYDTHS